MLLECCCVSACLHQCSSAACWPLTGSHTTGALSLSSLLRNTPEVESHDGLMLPTIPAWGSLLRSWSSLHRQQDCMELLRHLLTENCLPHLQCRWEARPLPGSVAARRPISRGLISIDLQLPRRTHDTTLQECIICWHEQKIPHGLLCAPEFLLVTLARYASVAKPCSVPASQCSLAQIMLFSGLRIAWLQRSYTLGRRPSKGTTEPSWPIHELHLVLPCRS